jgi:ribonuclease HI
MRLQARHKWLGQITNNQAEYQALIEGLRAAREWKPDKLEIYLDSKLVVEQLNDRWRVKESELVPLYRRAKDLLREFPHVTIEHVEREKNRGADHLANMAIDQRVPKKKFGG